MCLHAIWTSPARMFPVGFIRSDLVNDALKPMHNIGKVYVNASILYNNQEISNKSNL